MGRKGYLQFWCLCRNPSWKMMQDARGYQTIKWLVQRYKGQNQEIQKAAKILLDHEKEMQKAA